MAPVFRAAAAVASDVTPFTASKPAGTVAGDLMLLFHSDDTSVSDIAVPTGGASWALLDSRAGASGGTKIFWKIAGGSEPSTYTLAQANGADGVAAAVAVDLGGSMTPPLVTAQDGAPALVSVVPSPSVTPTGDDDLELRWAVGVPSGAAGLTWTSPGGYTERADVQSRGYTTAALATKALTSGAPTGVQNFTCSGSFPEWQAFTVAVGGASSRRSIVVACAAAVQRASW